MRHFNVCDDKRNFFAASLQQIPGRLAVFRFDRSKTFDGERANQLFPDEAGIFDHENIGR